MTTATSETFAPSPTRGDLVQRGYRDRIVGDMTIDAYAAFDRAAVEKHELIDGEVVRKGGGSPEHNLICANVLRGLGNALETLQVNGDALGSDQKVYVRDDFFLYPDAIIVCGESQFDAQDALRNPVVIVEVLSPSTAAFDLGRKFEAYRTLSSLEHYIVVEQDRASITHFAKVAGNLWAIVGEHSQFTDQLTIAIADTEVAVPLTAIYRRVSLPEAQIDQKD
jgi:Uma2 family endonuclease